MQYRRLGRIDFRPSVIGFGAMRLPQLDGVEAGTPGQFGSIDVGAADAMLRRAVEAGVNYVDTAYPYHDGFSERWLGHALRVVAADLCGPGPTGLSELRRRLKVATKLPMWLIESHDDCECYFSEQLDRLQLDSVDFYLLHGLRAGSVAKMRQLDILGWAEEALAAGRIGHFGFSFHDDYAVFEEVVDATDLWEFCQIQYNFMDEDYQAGTRGLRYAAEKGLGVIVMEPLRGGRLARRPPESVAALWAAANARRQTEGLSPRTPVEWALRWIWDHPEVSLLLSGVSSPEQLEENLAYAADAAAGALDEHELQVFPLVRAAYLEKSPIACTDCRYCLPCPNGVAISSVLSLYNDAIIYDGGPQAARLSYSWLHESSRAELCNECHECEERCPQGLPIADWLRRIREYIATE